MFKYFFSKTAVYLIIFFVVIPVVVLLVIENVSKDKLEDEKNNSFPVTEESGTIAESKMDELKIEEIVVGEGIEVVSGKKVTVNYSGTLTDGTKFDSSYDRGIPFSFNLGKGEVIKGWDIGVAGMKVGGKRKLTIPSSLGYGESGAGGAIPPNATLIFEVELLEVE